MLTNTICGASILKRLGDGDYQAFLLGRTIAPFN